MTSPEREELVPTPAGQPRRYLVRTFGCQMNEHDSERLAGLFESEGMVAAHSVEDADVVIFNTCCIRENADNRLYGNLGQLRALKQQRPGLQIAVGGCLAQKDRDKVLERAPWVDAVFGTHNVGHAADLLERARREGPVVEILESAATAAEEFPSALPVRRELPFAAWVTVQVGCDNKCAFCIVPSVRGREISRPFSEVVAEVRAIGGPGHRRGDPAGPERQLLRAGPGAAGPGLGGLAGARLYDRRRSGRRPVRPGRGHCSPTC